MASQFSRLTKLIQVMVGPAWRPNPNPERLKGFLSQLQKIFSLVEAPYGKLLESYYIEGESLDSGYNKNLLHHAKLIAIPSLLRSIAGTNNLEEALSGYIEPIELPALEVGQDRYKLAALNTALFGSPNSSIVRHAIESGSLNIEIKKDSVSKEEAQLILRLRKQGKLGGRQ